MDASLLAKHKGFEYRHQTTLLPVEPYIATHKHKCPLCFCKLYEMRSKPYVYCKSKKHKERFIMHKDKLK